MMLRDLKNVFDLNFIIFMIIIIIIVILGFIIWIEFIFLRNMIVYVIFVMIF